MTQPPKKLDCASCNPTSEQATGEATLAANGLSLTDDGRVFFNSTEGLVIATSTIRKTSMSGSRRAPARSRHTCHTAKAGLRSS